MVRSVVAEPAALVRKQAPVMLSTVNPVMAAMVVGRLRLVTVNKLVPNSLVEMAVAVWVIRGLVVVVASRWEWVATNNLVLVVEVEVVVVFVIVVAC